MQHLISKITFGLIALSCYGNAFALADTSKQPETLILYTEVNPPYNYQDRETGALIGSSVELLEELFSRAGQAYSMQILPWRRGYNRAREEPNTCVFSMNRTPAREHLFQWISPLYIGGWSIFKRPSSDVTLTSIEDVKNYSIVGKADSAAVAALEKQTGVKVVTTTGDERAAMMLYHGRAQLWISGVIDGPAAAQLAGLPVPDTALPWRKATLAMGCSKNTDPDLIKRLNALLGTMDDVRIAAAARHRN